MIIVSQDKKAIYNFDNVISLQIEPTLKEYTIEVYDAINDGSSLGIYSSEERAKEVLQEIISKYKTTLYNSKTNETIVNVPKVYEMPTK